MPLSHRRIVAPLAVAPLLALGLLAFAGQTARAAYVTISTGGTIDYGTDTSGLFGAANANLAGDTYALTLAFDAPPAGTYSYNSASDAELSGAIPGVLTVTVNGVTFTSRINNPYASDINETPYEIYAGNGDNGATQLLTATNDFNNSAGLFPVNLLVPFAYTGLPADSNADTVNFSVSDSAAGGRNASFTANPTSVSYTVPEPASMALLAGGLGLAGLARRRIRR